VRCVGLRRLGCGWHAGGVGLEWGLVLGCLSWVGSEMVGVMVFGGWITTSSELYELEEAM
jgi:hypothetical protein